MAPLGMKHRIHRDVVGLREGVGNDLEIEADTDFDGFRAGLGEQAVVETAAAPEAAAVEVEGEAGAEKGIDFLDWDFRSIGGGFENAEGSGC